MRHGHRNLLSVSTVCYLAYIVVLFTGCSGGGSSSTDDTSVTVLLAVDSAAAKPVQDGYVAAAKDVEIDEIESLTLTITEVSLDYAGEYESEGEGEGEDDDFDGSKLVVFSDEMEVDLLDLTTISGMISSANVPAGVYTKVRLSVSDPRLVLESDLDDVITDIHLTANGRLFVSETFEVLEGLHNLVILVFEDIHLVETGNGGYVLTPQLRAEVNVESADVIVSGTIVAVDTETGILTLLQGETEREVDYSAASIFLPTDTDIANGTEAHLVEGTEVTVVGTLWVDGLVTAEVIDIL